MLKEIFRQEDPNPSNPGISDPEYFRNSVLIAAAFTLLLWIIKAVEWSFGLNFAPYGIFPRTLRGLTGILAGPLIHGDLFHLLSNTMPLLMLGAGLFYFYRRVAAEVSVWIYLFSGFWVWLLGREAYHIGVSGIIYGLAAFLLFGGIFQRNRRLMAVSLAVLFLYGGLAYGLMPSREDPRISWESHLLGALVGFVLAVYFRKEKITDAASPLAQAEDGNPETTAVDFPAFQPPDTTGSSDYRIQFKPRKDKS